MDKGRTGVWIVMIAAVLVGCAGAEAPEPVRPVAAAPATRPAGETTAPQGYALPGDGQLVDAVAMTVNGEMVTLSDLFFPIRRQLREAARAGSPEAFMTAASRLIAQQVQQQIEQALVLREAQRRFGEAQKAYIDGLVADRIREMVLAEGGSRQRLDARLRAEGGSLEQATRTLRREFMGQLYLQGQFGSDLEIGRRELWAYYQAHRDEFTAEPKVTIRILAMPFSAFGADGADRPTDAARQAAIAAAEAALARIRGGEDFAAVVRKASVTTAYRSAQGGLWEAMARGSFRETAVEAVAFSGTPGEVSDVIVGQTGAFVVKTVDVAQGGMVPFEQAQGKILKILRAQAYRRLVAEHVQDLRRRAVIIPNEALDRLARQRAMQLYDQES